MHPTKLFSDHPASVGETYLQHQARAVYFAVRLLAAGMACLIHAFLPFLFVKTASHAVRELNEEMVIHRSRVSVSNARAGVR